MITFKYYHDRAAALAYVEKRLSGRNDGNGVAEDSGWACQGAHRLGLHGLVRLEQVRALFEKRHPVKGRPLRVRVHEEAAGAAPWLTEFVISSELLPSLALRENSEASFLHWHGAEAAMSCLEMFACAEMGPTGFLMTTGNVVAMTFERCCTRLGMGRLNTHLLLFNLTYCEPEEEWRELNTSEMEAETESAEIDYRDAIRSRLWIDGLIRERLRLHAGERLAAQSRQAPLGLN